MANKSYYPLTWCAAPWFKGISYMDYRDKNAAVQTYVRYMLDRVGRMFDVKGLPDTMPEYIVKQMLYCNGHIFIPDNVPYALCGTFGGEPTPYYMGSKYVVANPALTIETEYNIETDGTLIKNDSGFLGIIPMCNHYATLLAENDLSIINNMVIGRAAFIIGAGTDADKLSADDFIRSLWTGELKSVLENRFVDGIKVNPGVNSSDSRLTQLVETNQFIKASWFNALGLDANYNMKRESLTANEVEQNSDSLMPLVDDMLTCWRDGFNRYNERNGANVTVEFASSWKDNNEQIHIDEGETPNDKGGEDDVAIN